TRVKATDSPSITTRWTRCAGSTIGSPSTRSHPRRRTPCSPNNEAGARRSIDRQPRTKTIDLSLNASQRAGRGRGTRLQLAARPAGVASLLPPASIASRLCQGGPDSHLGRVRAERGGHSDMVSGQHALLLSLGVAAWGDGGVPRGPGQAHEGADVRQRPPRAGHVARG